MRARMFVEISYFASLADEKGVRELKALTKKQKKSLQDIVDRFNDRDVERIRAIEKKTKHDVKAIEYYLKERIERAAGLKMRTEFIHFGLTSEDVNNLAYGVLIHDALKRVIRPELTALIAVIRTMANANRKRRMLSLTHGQPATPSTLGKELMVFVDRLERQKAQLNAMRMQGKFGGAVGTYAAHESAYPDVHWPLFGRKFIKSLGLTPLENTTQINPHDDLAELAHILVRINTILLDFARDMWFYISRGVFVQKVVKGEVGSSTMPHKVNPIDFENAEGNLGLSMALFSHFAEKLPISRLQRDLSDSTVQRNIGVAFGYHMLAVTALQKGLRKVSVDTRRLEEELAAHPELHAEAIQTVMRKNGFTDAYERLKNVTRGERVTLGELQAFIEKLDIASKDKRHLLMLMEIL